MNAPTDIATFSMVQKRLGIAKLTRVAFEKRDLGQIATSLLLVLARDPTNYSALMDLSVVEQLKGNIRTGLKYQSSALAKCQLYQTETARNTDLRLLVLAAPIDFGSNTPVEFLLEESKISLTTLFVSPSGSLPERPPEHDLAFVALPGDSDHTRHFLSVVDKYLKNWPRPVLNRPRFIQNLDRDSLHDLVVDTPRLVSPPITRVSRSRLAAFGRGQGDLGESLAIAPFPMVVRPVGSHAGYNLARLTHISDIPYYLDNCTETEFFVSRFVDYRSADGKFRKYRIIFVDGHPYPCHMAISDQWKVWYMNAGMDKSEWKRAEEESFMTRFNQTFGARHEDTLDEVARRLEMEYFGIDCAETLDRELVLFEVDNALIVHDMDPPELYPYKQRPIHAIYTAFVDMLYCRKRSAGLEILDA